MYTFKFLSENMENMYFAKAVIIGVDMKSYYVSSKINRKTETYSLIRTILLNDKKTL